MFVECHFFRENNYESVYIMLEFNEARVSLEFLYVNMLYFFFNIYLRINEQK